MILRADSSILIVIDVQARLLPAVAEPAATVRRVALMMTAARRLGVRPATAYYWVRQAAPPAPIATQTSEPAASFVQLVRATASPS